MEPQHILALNFIAMMLDTEDPKVCVEFLDKMQPDDKVHTLFHRVLQGPFGHVEFPEQCECQAWDGYKAAINEMIEVIQSRPFPYPNDRRAITVEREELIEILTCTLQQQP